MRDIQVSFESHLSLIWLNESQMSLFMSLVSLISQNLKNRDESDENEK